MKVTVRKEYRSSFKKGDAMFSRKEVELLERKLVQCEQEKNLLVTQYTEELKRKELELQQSKEVYAAINENVITKAKDIDKIIEKVFKGIEPTARIAITEDWKLLEPVAHGINTLLDTFQQAVSIAESESMELAIGFSEHFEVLKKVAEGDLILRMDYKGKNEMFAMLAQSTNKTIENLATLTKKIKESSVHLSSYAAEVTSAAEESSAGSVSQAGAIAELRSTIEEWFNNIKRISDNSAEVGKIASETLQCVKHGHDAMKQVDGSMMEIKDWNLNIANSILNLGEKSQKIGEIVKIIEDIADQTNILALNASIEAARAGEVGKSFAVVASAVKKLAESVRESTKEISELIRELQTSTNTTVLATERATKVVEKGGILTNDASASLNNILPLMEKTNQAVALIANSIQEQKVASTQVVTSIENIATIGKENAVTSKETIAQVKELNTMTVDLKKVVENFNV